VESCRRPRCPRKRPYCPAAWRRRFRRKGAGNLFCQCTWFWL